jgi:5-hydroxyisourate hydrolase-like protein (transthyretin family)
LQVEGKSSKRSLVATLVEAGEDTAVAGKTISFWVDGRQVGTAVTDSRGVASFALDKKDSAGQHDYRAVFEQDDYFEGSASSTSTGKTKG